MNASTGNSAGLAHRTRGFTLVELLVAMLLGILLAGAAAGLFTSLRQLHEEQERAAQMKENLRFVSEFVARDIRGAGLRADGAFDPAGVEPQHSGLAEQQRFTVRKAGMNCLGQTGTWVASVYSVHDRQLRCGNDAIPPQNQPLVSGVRSLTAVALDADGFPDWALPVALRIELELETGAGRHLRTRTLEFVVSLRNAVLERRQESGSP